MTNKLVSLADVIRWTTLSKAAIYKGILDKTFPPQIKLSKRRVAWSAKAIEDWVDAQICGEPLRYDARVAGEAHE